MEENFKKIIEELKNEKMDTQKAKEYICIIKRFLDKFINNCEGELSKEECLEQFLEYYNSELKTNPNETNKIVFELSQYNSYKELLKLYKSNKSKFKKVVTTAKEKEKTSSKEALFNTLNSENQLIISMRDIFRMFPKLSKKELVLLIQKRKSQTSEYLKSKIINSIQRSVGFLNEYGILDSYIEEANEEFEKLNLEGLKLKKYYCLPDEIGDGKGNFIKYDENGKLCKYDENGKIVNDGDDLDKYEEDIGVIDTFDEDYLKKLSVEDLFMMDTFWKSKYWQERIEMSKAMASIKFLDLWPTILNKGEEAIEQLDDVALSNALKRDLALTYLCRNNKNVTLKIKRQYSKFLKESNMSKRGKIEDEINEETEELNNLTSTANDIALEECFIISKLKTKDFNVKDWGVIEFEKAKSDDNEEKIVVFAIENPNFRGTLIMSVPEIFLKDFLNTEDIKLPKFKNTDKIDEDYSNIMAKLYLPVNNYFKKYIAKKYQEDPSSELIASLAGKKAKKTLTEKKEDLSL